MGSGRGCVSAPPSHLLHVLVEPRVSAGEGAHRQVPNVKVVGAQRSLGRHGGYAAVAHSCTRPSWPPVNVPRSAVEENALLGTWLSAPVALTRWRRGIALSAISASVI